MKRIGSPRRALDELTAFDAMRVFLESYWERGGKQSGDLAALLGSLNRDVRDDSLPLDIALWEDWREAVNRAHANVR